MIDVARSVETVFEAVAEGDCVAAAAADGYVVTVAITEGDLILAHVAVRVAYKVLAAIAEGDPILADVTVGAHTVTDAVAEGDQIVAHVAGCHKVISALAEGDKVLADVTCGGEHEVIVGVVENESVFTDVVRFHRLVDEYRHGVVLLPVSPWLPSRRTLSQDRPEVMKLR